MNLMHRCCRLAMRSAAVLAIVTGAWACSDNDIKTSGDDPVNGPLDPVEAYTRAFVKEFGQFKAQKWTDGVDGVISVRTSKPTEINVFADIEGHRFLFASLGRVYGTQPVVVHIPEGVEELIVAADGMEYKTPLGKLLDLTDGSRRYIDPTFATELPAFGNLNVKYDVGVREIQLTGSKYNSWLKDKWAYELFDSDYNFEQPKNKQGTNGLFVNSRIALNINNIQQMTVYPLYWRENVHGESDYMLGIYYFEEGSEQVNQELIYKAHTIKMIDFEDFDFGQSITCAKSANGAFTVSGTSAPNNVKTEADLKNMNNTNYQVRSKGVHITLEDRPDDPAFNFGFYIKSGLKPGYTEGKGRNYTHITFQSAMYNAAEWGDNYWDVKMADVEYAYTGACFGNRSMVPYSNQKPVRVDGLTAAELGTNDVLYYPIGFMSQPDGAASNANPDFCDVVLGLSINAGATLGSIGQNLTGETFGTYPWTLAAEDLGSTDDWDFNDLVVNIYDLTTDLTRPYTNKRGYFPSPNLLGRRITVLPQAAGGTYPIYLMYEGDVSEDVTDDSMVSAFNSAFKKGTYVVGTELHAWLGQPDYTQMLNTGRDDGHSGCAVSFFVPLLGTDELDFDIHNPPQSITGDDQPIRNFWVLVDKENEMRFQLENTAFDSRPLEHEYNSDRTQVTRHLSQTKNVLKEFDGKLGEGAYRVDQPRATGSLAPQMLMTSYNWRWPVERANIGKVYSSFRDWVAGKRQTWYNVTFEGNNAYDPTQVCDYTPTAWIQ
ncbi:MAG: LruC domain-containing protein [Bacteroides sp.]|nr:LruC domain-containing protein [Bacteroides sp.]